MEHVLSRLEVPSRMEYIRPLSVYVGELAKDAGFDRKEASKIKASLIEVLTNVIENLLESNPDEFFTIVTEKSDTDLRLRIQVKGVPFDPLRVPVHSPDFTLDRSSGPGMALMEKAMNVVRYVNRGKEGMEICLIKRVGKQRIDRRLAPSEKTPFRAAAKATPPSDFTIRNLLPEEAIEVSRCAYRAYGYTYAEYIYYPEKIVEYNQKGLMRSFVAVTDDGRLMGHMALKFQFVGASIAELGVAFVKPEFRKMGLAASLGRHAVEQGRNMGLSGIVARPATSHRITQRLCAEMGFCECGIMLGVFPEDLEFKELCGKVKQRESEVVFFKPLRAFSTTALYPTVLFRDLVERVYGRMGIPCTFPKIVAAKAGNAFDTPVIRVDVTPSLNVAEIMVSGYGAGDFEELRSAWRQMCLQKISAVYLFLNMEDARCEGFVGKCLALGFLPAGVLPNGVSDRHALLLQYLNNIEINPEGMEFHSDRARELFGFITKRA